MPPHTRSQRRRQNARRQPRPAASTEMISRAPSIGTPVDSEEIEELAAIASPPARPAPSQPARATSRRRVLSRSTPEPIDYTQDYRAVRRDLRWILLWTVLLLGAMIVLKFSGIV